ncbi:Tetratricopeptide repeat-containing protein [Mucilaginibacter mallensis]|uniref:Peptidyl-prolyl cis-trans isomerase n=1 Tax=Mucilaginibacter mallensis TaxID=652787 RepID=A0A1H2BQQ4_MUCMA|nr:FKBP-type peptidyl-prolyl cis-trans isomerase [Mucilaginibacter mallensis]SDT60377.1 Tetratricopeptide repeat-containing protein [Mucilaginibacter mallensis]
MKKNLLTLICTVCFCGIAFAQKTDTITTASGLKYFFKTKGSGAAFIPGQLAIVDYILTLTDGKQIDATADRGTPFAAQVPGKLIKGFNEAIPLMHIGDRAVFILPSNIAYGEKGTGTIPPNSTLIFDITLLDTKAKSLGMVLDSILFAKPVTADSKPQIDTVLKTFNTLKKAKFKDLYVSEDDLNSIGYELIKKYPADAVELFKLNVKLYPKSYNAYDSLGEGYMDMGDNKQAIKNYEKSLKLNPKNTNATDMIKKMQTGGKP